MKLPETKILNYFNKVLFSIQDLTLDKDSCSVISLINHCKSFTLGGSYNIDYEIVLKHCKECGFVSFKTKNVVLCLLGHKFLKANINKSFEITEAQKQIIAEKIIFKGAWSRHAIALFENFYINRTTALYEFSLNETSLNTLLNVSIHFFKYIGILYAQDLNIIVNKKYSQFVYELTTDRKIISEQRLEQLLIENRILGADGENAIVEFEKKRLIKLGKNIQADLVRRISTSNVGAGYDIESFNGTTNDVFPNRFIEAKATSGDYICFYWTINERKVAKEKKEKYWIYILTNFKNEKSYQLLPIMIQNPENVIPKNDSFLIEINKYLISEISEINLHGKHIDELKWYEI